MRKYPNYPNLYQSINTIMFSKVRNINSTHIKLKFQNWYIKNDSCHKQMKKIM